MNQPAHILRRVFARLTGSGRSVALNASIVAVAFAASRVLGMVREIVIAAQFGTGETYDAYIAAFRIPDLLFMLVMSGAFGSAFIPVFAGHLARNSPESAWRLANALLTWAVLIFVLLAQVILWLAGPLVTRVIAPELSPDAQELAINLTRLFLLSPLLLGLGAAGKGILESHDAFTLPAFAPILYNMGIILGAIALTPLIGVYGLAAGVIAGAFAHAGIQFVQIIRLGFRPRPSLARDVDGLGEVVRLMAPRVASQAASQMNLIVMTNFASRLGDGRISALHYAQSLVLLPHGVLALSVSTVIFPLMARQFAMSQLDDLMQTLRRAIGVLVFLSIPAAIGLFIFRYSIVQVVFEYGSFTSESTELVASALGFFAIGLVARVVAEPVTRAFYAMHDTRTPLVIALSTIAVNVGLSWVLSGWMGHTGLALSLSITYVIRMMALLGVLFARTGGLRIDGMPSLFRMMIAGAPFVVVAHLLADPVAGITEPDNHSRIPSYLGFLAAIGVSLVVYLGASYLLRIPEFEQVRQRLRRARS
jgi:putative peptidoglycan lipid II flippase